MRPHFGFAAPSNTKLALQKPSPAMPSVINAGWRAKRV